MQGSILARGKCPVCKGKWTHIPRMGYVCPTCQTVPKRFRVGLWHDGQWIILYSKDREPLYSYRDAERLLDQINDEIKNHTFEPSRYISSEQRQFYLTNLADHYMRSKAKTLAPSYVKDVRRMVETIKTFFGDKDVRDLKKKHIIDFKENCEENTRWSAKTVKNIMDILRGLLRYCRDDLDMGNSVPAFPDLDVPEPSVKWLTPEDRQSVFEKVPDEDKPIVAFLMLHGCRPGEARALKCRDINDDMTVTIHATFSRNIYREKRKGKRAKEYTIPINPELAEYLMSIKRGNLPEAWVFPNPRTGDFYGQEAVGRLWRSVRVKAQAPDDLRLYDASRHSFASQLVNEGESIYAVRDLLGHSSVKMTEKYAHNSAGKLRVTISRVSLVSIGNNTDKEKKSARDKV